MNVDLTKLQTGLPRCPLKVRHTGIWRERALELFATKGFVQVGMRELANHLGVTPGALYHHYPSKQHLLFDFIVEFYEEMLSALRCQGRLSPDPLAFLVKVHLDLYHAMPWHFSIVFQDSNSLTADQQIEVQRLRLGYLRSISQVLDLTHTGPSLEVVAVADAIAQLLNVAPTWFRAAPLTDQARMELTSSLITGAIERMLGVWRGCRALKNR